jgi:RimJ/RimL family protein N-acetyltransferase
MNTRVLLPKDVKHQLEWMHDEEIYRQFQLPFEHYTYNDVLNFIHSIVPDQNLHLAIVDDHDEYLGTVSLKNIDHSRHDAELALVVRKSKWGQGVARYAMKRILDEARNLQLRTIYLTVLSTNQKAIALYLKHGFTRDVHRDCKLNLRNVTVVNEFYIKEL